MRTTILLLTLVAGCSVGEVPLTGGGGGVDAARTDGGGNVAACVNRGTAGQAHQHAGAVTHAGENCQQGGCHGPASVNTEFTASGTVFKQDGTTPNGGANVRIVFGATTRTATTDNAGNFYFTQPITFPATTDVTACPDTTPMVSPISAGEGACSSAGCHASAGGTQGPIKFQP